MGTGLRSGGLMVRVLVQTNLGGVLAAGDAGELHVCVKRLFYATKRGGDRVNVNLRTVPPLSDQLVSEASCWIRCAVFSPCSEEAQEAEFNSHESPAVKTMIKGPPSTQGKNGLTDFLFDLCD